MTSRASARAGASILVTLLLSAGCAGNEAGPGPGRSSSRGSPAAEAADYPDEGVDLLGRPALDGVYERALQTYVDFERGRRLAAREGKVGRLLSFTATSRVVDPYREALAAYDGRGTFDGDVTIEFLDIRPRDLALTVDVCVDATALQVPEGAPTLLGEATRARQRITVTSLEGPWRVTEVEALDGSC